MSGMARPSSGEKIQKRLVENITLLWAMCEVPNMPKENELSGSQDEHRRLSLNREKQLVDSFAFIAASTDDPLRIMAVCIEECQKKGGMIIRLASNTGDLSSLKQGFTGIAQTLEQASSKAKPSSELRRDLFEQVIMLDQRRILSRLRSRHAPRTQFSKGKPPLLPILYKTIQDISTRSHDEATSASLRRIQLSSERLCEKFTSLEAACEDETFQYSLRALLHDILIQISEFDVATLQTVLNTSSLIEPTVKTSLPLKISKLGRYHRITCDFIDAARSSHCTLFRHISVQVVAKPHINMASIINQLAGFEQTYRRVTSSSHQSSQIRFDPRSAAAVQKRFETRMADHATRWKVHAEIQILLFYEQNPSRFPPRIIGSSKSACYLCDLFIQLHGHFQVPRSHGKLYDRWILPEEALDHLSASPHLMSVVEGFNAKLEAQTLDILTNKRKPYPHPAESVLIFRQPWSPNPTLSIIHSQKSLRKMTEYLSTSQSEGSTVRHSSSSSSFSLPVIRDSTEPMEMMQSSPDDGTSSSIPTETLSSNPITTVRHLTQGQSTICRLARHEDVLIVHMDIGKVYASWDHLPGDTTSNFPHTGCWVQVSWPASSSPTLETNRCFEGIDIRALACDHDHIFEEGAAFSSKELALQMKGYVVLVKYSLETPQRGGKPVENSVRSIWCEEDIRDNR
ncbi:MAG: hypothetical protein Q9215_007151 [Flavoplaca cf. flavocitrina]